jgi:hypothetical protein
MLEYWRDELASCRYRLTQDATDLNAWIWRIRVRILSFLLSQYRGGTSCIPRRPIIRVRFEGDSGSSMNRPPRSGSVLRPLLDRIADEMCTVRVDADDACPERGEKK